MLTGVFTQASIRPATAGPTVKPLSTAAVIIGGPVSGPNALPCPDADQNDKRPNSDSNQPLPQDLDSGNQSVAASFGQGIAPNLHLKVDTPNHQLQLADTQFSTSNRLSSPSYPANPNSLFARGAQNPVHGKVHDEAVESASTCLSTHHVLNNNLFALP